MDGEIEVPREKLLLKDDPVLPKVAERFNFGVWFGLSQRFGDG